MTVCDGCRSANVEGTLIRATNYGIIATTLCRDCFDMLRLVGAVEPGWKN